MINGSHSKELFILDSQSHFFCHQDFFYSMKCKNCGANLSGNYCAECGVPAKLKRINAQYIIHEIEHVLHLDKGIFYTLKELFIRPGKSVREFILESRNRLVKPIIFIILTSLVYSVLNSTFHFEDGYVTYGNLPDGSVNKIFSWVQSHYGYANILMSVFIAFWLKLFFRKHEFNFFEIIILLCYVVGVCMILLGVFGVLESLTSWPLTTVGAYLFFFYATWAIGQFYESKFANYLKALFAYILGYVSFLLVLFLVGYLVDLVLK
jgi:ribosomal protein L37E